MANIKGRNVRVEVAATFDSPAIAITSVSQASPAVAGKTAHGLANNDVGYFSGVTGMDQIEYQAIRVKNKTDDTFELQGLNTTNFSAFTAGNLTTVATWALLAEATGYELGGGASEKLDVTRLIDFVRKVEAGLLPEQTVNLSVLAQDTPSAAQQVIESAVQSQGIVLVRITLGNGAVRIFTAEPSTPGESVQVGQIGTGSMDFAVKGLVLKLAA